MASDGLLLGDNEMLVAQWNNHNTRTPGGPSPCQPYINWILDVHNCNYSAVENIYGADQGNPMYGVDDSNELEVNSDNNVQVPQLDFLLNDEDTYRLRDLVDPHEDYGNHGVSNLLQVVYFISNLDSWCHHTAVVLTRVAAGWIKRLYDKACFIFFGGGGTLVLRKVRKDYLLVHITEGGVCWNHDCGDFLCNLFELYPKCHSFKNDLASTR